MPRTAEATLTAPTTGHLKLTLACAAAAAKAEGLAAYLSAFYPAGTAVAIKDGVHGDAGILPAAQIGADGDCVVFGFDPTIPLEDRFALTTWVTGALPGRLFTVRYAGDGARGITRGIEARAQLAALPERWKHATVENTAYRGVVKVHPEAFRAAYDLVSAAFGGSMSGSSASGAFSVSLRDTTAEDLTGLLTDAGLTVDPHAGRAASAA